jgi:ubiquitin-conjugating enzyme E2 J1
MIEHDQVVKENGGANASREEVVPEQLRLAYREDLGPPNGKAAEKPTVDAAATSPSIVAAGTVENATPAGIPARIPAPTSTVPLPAPPLTPAMMQEQLRARRRQIDEELPGWLNPAIYAVMGALVYILWRRFM